MIGPEFLLDVNFDERQAASREGLEIVKLLHVLERDLDSVRDFQLDFGWAGAGVGSGNNGNLDGELRNFELPETEVAGNTGRRRPGCPVVALRIAPNREPE